MSIKAVSAAVGLLFLLPAISTGASDENPLQVRLRANAHLTRTETVSDLDTRRWYEGRLVDADRDSVTLAMNSAGDPARLRVPRWAITAFQVRRGSDRAGPAFIGALVGLGVGLAVAGAGCAHSGLGCDEGMRFMLSVTPPLGFAIGAAVGRARWETVPVDLAAPPRP